MSIVHPNIRPPRPSDVEALTALLHQLGYPTTHASVEAQLKAMATDPSMRVFVAELGDVVVGLATGHLLLVIQDDRPLAMLSALVVREGQRGSGIGRRLVEAVEDWARGAGADRIVVNSGLARTDAHAFYERIGYAHTARRFSRSL